IARLEVAPVGMKTWDDVALWYHELAEAQIKAGKGVKSKALELTAGVDNNYEKLKNIYEWARDQVRYVAVEIGIGGFQPHPAEEILLNRYGDCKDMTTLICSLAREAGIEAYEVLVSTWQNGMPDTSLPSPLQFNHAIAYCPKVGENGAWLDATEKGCPYGRLPWYDQGLPMLVVGKEGTGEIIFSPRVPADSNQTIFEWTVNLEANGAASVQGKTRYKGTVADEMRDLFYYASSEQQKNWLEIFLATRCSSAKLDSFQIAGLNPVHDPVIITYSFRTSAFSVPNDSQMTLHPGQILAFDLPDYFRASNRKHPIQFRFGAKSELNLTVNIPDEWEIKTRNSSDSLVSHFGKATWDCSVHEKILNVRITSFLNGTAVQPGQYREFQDFIDRIKAKDLREIVLQPTK
ncbi:MAG TPA: transglutaminase-like domain-containing protein, partial [bacterium]